jgi:hypothetical protein
MKFLFPLSVLTGMASAGRIQGHLSKKDLPTGRDWVTLENGVEFQPGADVDPKMEHVRKLWGAQSTYDTDPYYTPFANAGETYYDEYSQAWRALGFYIDCDATENADQRKLEDEESSGCVRYMLWAAVSSHLVCFCFGDATLNILFRDDSFAYNIC